jgi:phospholipid/cholesterol/gamma-HCH transport system substrate-binding protein
MSLEANKFRLGLFFVTGSVVFVLGMIWLTGWFKSEETTIYVCYFSESVQGLENGSSVRYSGVPVGTVKSIEVAPDGRLVEVVVEIDAGFDVAGDMAARLDLIGITGMKVINLKIFDPALVTYPILSFRPRYPVIPVVKSSLETLDVGLERLVEIMSEVDVQQISDQTVLLLSNLNSILDSDSISMIMHRVAIASARVDTLAMVYTELGRNLNDIALRAGEDFPDLARDLHTLTLEFTAFTETVAPLAEGLDEVLAQVYSLSIEFRAVLDRARDHPEEFLMQSPQEDRWP